MTRVTQLTIFGVLLLSMSVLFSCNKAEDDPAPQPDPETELSDREAAEVVEASLAQSNGGLMEEMQSTTDELESMPLLQWCDSLFADTLFYEYNGAQVQATSLIGWTAELNCNELSLPETAGIAIGSEISFSTPRISCQGSGDFAGALSGLEFSSPVVIWNGTYIRSGAYEFNFRQRNNGTSALDLTLTDIVVDKAEQSIQSGTGVFTLIVTLNGSSATYEGTLTFHGDQQATLIINGVEFPIDLS